ncbi:angiotensin-converting enzyme-like [Rhipicephalus microplus]|uniref:angiotensin-converting enzyme-like n=1 Tax=Rhipicephalus microplus TaxID=6941 RepID=UPI003F6D18BB
MGPVMMKCILCLFLLREMAAVGESPCLSEQCVVPNTVVQKEEAAAESYLMGELESAQNRMCADIATALWNFEAELSQLTARSLGETLQNYSAHAAQVWADVARFNWTSFTNSTLRRAFRKLSFMGKKALDEESLAKYLELEALLSSIRSNVTLCQYKGAWKEDDDGCHLTYSDLRRIMSLSENSAERLHYFKEWTRQTRRFGRAFSEILTIISAESKMNGFKSAADYVMNPYEWPTFREDTEVFWNKLLPLYQRMHAVVRERLTRKYGSKRVASAGPIDVHLLDIQGCLTSTVAGLTDPLKTSTWNGEQISLNLKRENFTEIDAFKEAEAFYVSLGLPQLPEGFWTKSSIQAPALMKGDSACQASAWDFCDGQDYRIRMCAERSISGLATLFHELGHVHYFMLYADQPHVFRTGANAAFHEAVADALSWLAIQSKRLREHLGFGLTDAAAETQHQMALAFDHVGQLFHGIATSKWMWTLLDEPASRENMDSLYWDMRLRYEGIRSPRPTSNAHSLADYIFSGHMNRMRSICSLILQMQIIQYFCRGANHTGRLNECDIFGSKEAGKRLTSILKLGSSKPFSHVMKMLSDGRQETVDAAATLEYFLPTLEWLKGSSVRRFGWDER